MPILTDLNLDDDWANFASEQSGFVNIDLKQPGAAPNTPLPRSVNAKPVATPDEVRSMIGKLSISTMSKIFHLNVSKLNVDQLFWKLPVIPYSQPSPGVIKKQIGVKMKSPQEVVEYTANLAALARLGLPYEEKITGQMSNSNTNARRNQFKDNRVLTVGLTNKSIVNCNTKKKRAFINCFAVNQRVVNPSTGRFCEFHLKLFKTANITIPGITDDNPDGLIDAVKVEIINLLSPYVVPEDGSPLRFLPDDDLPMKKNIVKNKKGTIVANRTQTGEEDMVNINVRKGCHTEYTRSRTDILINSNFDCGFLINQAKFARILTEKYGLEATYNKVNYPGIKCRYYLDTTKPIDRANQTGVIDPADYDMEPQAWNNKYTQVTFIPFRTGRALLLGAFSKSVLMFMYNEVIVPILVEEYPNIHNPNGVAGPPKIKCTKPKKRTIFSSETFSSWRSRMVDANGPNEPNANGPDSNGPNASEPDSNAHKKSSTLLPWDEAQIMFEPHQIRGWITA